MKRNNGASSAVFDKVYNYYTEGIAYKTCCEIIIPKVRLPESKVGPDDLAGRRGGALSRCVDRAFGIASSQRTRGTAGRRGSLGSGSTRTHFDRTFGEQVRFREGGRSDLVLCHVRSHPYRGHVRCRCCRLYRGHVRPTAGAPSSTPL